MRFSFTWALPPWTDWAKLLACLHNPVHAPLIDSLINRHFSLHLVNQSIILCLLTVNQSSEICTLMSRKRTFCSSAIGFPVSANEHGSIPGAAKTSNGAQMVYLEHIRWNVLVLCYYKTGRTRGATFQPPPQALERKGNENEPAKSIPCCSVLETLCTCR